MTLRFTMVTSRSFHLVDIAQISVKLRWAKTKSDIFNKDFVLRLALK